LPIENTVGALMAFGTAQTGQLDKANSRTRDTITIISNCEALFKKAQADIQPQPWWKLW
jgi:hypothetical protein